jgi:ubiquinol-cytochrome c reductase iron-sulfur subunit
VIREHRAPIGVAVAALAAACVAAVLLVAGADGRHVAAAVGVAAAISSVALGLVAAELKPSRPDVEERHQRGPAASHRRMLLRFGMGAAGLTAVGVAIPAVRRLDRVVDELRATAWTAGTRAVDAAGTPVVFADVVDGDLLTVYPEGHVDDVDSQAVLIKEPPERYSSIAEDGGWIVDGAVIYSKLCTHMACSLGLYQQASGTLLCPCHQGVFDVLAGGIAVHGPPERRLPHLPFRVDERGHVVALSDFSGAVGTGFWWRP